MDLSKSSKLTSTRPYIVIYQTTHGDGRQSFVNEEPAREFIEQYKGQYNILGLYEFNSGIVLSDDLPDKPLRERLLDEYVERHFPKETSTQRRQRLDKEFSRLVMAYYAKKFAQVGATIVIAGLINHFNYLTIPSWLGIGLAALFYGGGTLGYLVLWRVQTFSGTTKPEKVNERLLIGSYILGTFFTILSV